MKVAVPKRDGGHPTHLDIPDWTHCVIAGIKGLLSLYSLIGVMILLPVCAAAQSPTKTVLILSGANPNYHIPSSTVPNVTTLDWRELRRWEISEQKLPLGSVVRFRQPSFWELYNPDSTWRPTDDSW